MENTKDINNNDNIISNEGTMSRAQALAYGYISDKQMMDYIRAEMSPYKKYIDFYEDSDTETAGSGTADDNQVFTNTDNPIPSNNNNPIPTGIPNYISIDVPDHIATTYTSTSKSYTSPPNAGKRWTAVEEKMLVDGLNSGCNINPLAIIHGRTPLGLQYRVVKILKEYKEKGVDIEPIMQKWGIPLTLYYDLSGRI